MLTATSGSAKPLRKRTGVSNVDLAGAYKELREPATSALQLQDNTMEPNFDGGEDDDAQQLALLEQELADASECAAEPDNKDDLDMDELMNAVVEDEAAASDPAAGEVEDVEDSGEPQADDGAEDAAVGGDAAAEEAGDVAADGDVQGEQQQQVGEGVEDAAGGQVEEEEGQEQQQREAEDAQDSAAAEEQAPATVAAEVPQQPLQEEAPSVAATLPAASKPGMAAAPKRKGLPVPKAAPAAAPVFAKPTAAKPAAPVGAVKPAAGTSTAAKPAAPKPVVVPAGAPKPGGAAAVKAPAAKPGVPAPSAPKPVGVASAAATKPSVPQPVAPASTAAAAKPMAPKPPSALGVAKPASGIAAATKPAVAKAAAAGSTGAGAVKPAAAAGVLKKSGFAAKPLLGAGPGTGTAAAPGAAASKVSKPAAGAAPAVAKPKAKVIQARKLPAGDEEGDEDDDGAEDEAAGTAGPSRPAKAAPKAAAKASAKPRAKPAKKEAEDKRPRSHSAFMFFCAAMRATVKEENPGLSMTDVSKKLGELWGQLSADDKAPYQAEADASKAEVSEQQKAWDEQHPKEAKPRGAGPKTAYQFYATAQRAELVEANPESSSADINKLLGQAWKELADDERQPYMQLAADAKESAAEAGDAVFAAKVAKPPKAAKGGTARGGGAKRAREEAEAADGADGCEEAAGDEAGGADAMDIGVAAGDLELDLVEEGEEPKPAAAKRAKTAPSRGGSKKRRAAAAVVADKQDEEEQQEEDDEDDRDNVDWEAHPAEDIIAHTRTKYIVKRVGLPLTEYGTVDMKLANRQRLHMDCADAAGSAPACPVPLALVEDYEEARRAFGAAVAERAKDDLDLEDLEEGSPLEACSFIGTLRGEADDNKRDCILAIGGVSVCVGLGGRKMPEIKATVPAMALSFVMQRSLVVERRRVARLEQQVEDLTRQVAALAGEGGGEEEVAV